MRNDRRQFYIYDLEIAARKEGAAIPTFDDLLPVYEKMRANQRTYPIRADTATLLIGDLTHDPVQQLVTMLVRLSDKTAPNSVTSDPAAGLFTVHTRSASQGADFGCHVIISTAQEANFPNTYTCAIERVQGIAPDLVRRLLSKLLNYEFNDDASFYSYPHPAGGLTRQGLPRVDRCCPHIELRGRPSDTLIADINNGQITGVSLIKAEAVTPMAGAAFLTKTESELRLAVNQNNLPGNLWQSLVQAFQASAGTYGVAKVSYKAPGVGRSVTVEIDAASGNPLHELYIRSYEVNGINPLLDNSALSVVAHFRDMAIPTFLTERNI